MTQTPLKKPHRVYAQLVGEVSPVQVLWEQNGKKLHATELLDHINDGTDTGFRYAEVILSQALAFFSEKGEMLPGVLERLDVSVSPLAVVVEQLRHLPPDTVLIKYMSKTMFAGETADLLEQGDDEGANIYMSDIFRISVGRIRRSVK